MPPEKDRQFANTLARGLEVLRCFGVGDALLGNKDISTRTGFPKATVSRLTYTLTQLGYLRRKADLGKYELSSAVLSIGYPLLANMNIRQIARPFMNDLADYACGAVNLGLRDRTSMIYVETCRSNDAVAQRPDIGSAMPVIQSAMGRAWLAQASEAEREKAIREIRFKTPELWREYKTAVEQALRDFRSLGFTIARGDWRRDVHAVAVPLKRKADEDILVFNCGVPVFQLKKRTLENDLGPRLLSMVGSIETVMGLR